MATTTFTREAPRELAHRENDGIEVTLFWHPVTDQVTVCLRDHRCRSYFEIKPDPRYALEAFHHPYSYPNSKRSRPEPTRST